VDIQKQFTVRQLNDIMFKEHFDLRNEKKKYAHFKNKAMVQSFRENVFGYVKRKAGL